jgi:hypothetical protein
MHRGGGGWGRMRRRRGVVMTNTEIFHIFHIISLFNLLFFIFSIFFHISTYFSSIISKSFYYSTYLSSIFSLSFHYLTYLSSIFFISFHYSNYVSSVLFISFHYSTYFSSVFSISSHYSTWVSSKFFISFHYSRNIRSNFTCRASPGRGRDARMRDRKCPIWIYLTQKRITRIILRPLSALSLDEGLNSPCDKNALAALWKREPISDDYLSSMRKSILSISGNVCKQQEMEIDKLINDA